MADVTIESRFLIDLNQRPDYQTTGYIDISITEEKTEGAFLDLSIVDNSNAFVDISIVQGAGVISNALAVPAFPGTVEMSWDCDDDMVDHFDIYVSYDAVTYDEIEINIADKNIIIYGLRNNVEMRFRITGFYADGTTTNTEDFYLGEKASRQVDIAFTAVPGSLIPAETILPFRSNEFNYLLRNPSAVEFSE